MGKMKTHILTVVFWLVAAVLHADTLLSSGSGDINNAATWGGTAPQSGDTLSVSDGHAVTINASMTATLTAGGNTGYFTMATGTFTITGNVTYGGTATAGLVRVSGGALTIAGTVTNTSSGYAVAMTSTGALTVTNVGGTAVTAAGGRALDLNGSGAVAIVGTVTHTGDCWAVYARNTSVVTMTGNIVGGFNGGSAFILTGGTLNLTGNISCTVRSAFGSPYITGGTMNWIGDAALAAGADAYINMNGGTLNLANDTLGDYLRLQCAGRMAICSISAATINKSSAARSGRLIETGPNAQIAVVGKAIPVEKWQFPRR